MMIGVTVYSYCHKQTDKQQTKAHAIETIPRRLYRCGEVQICQY